MRIIIGGNKHSYLHYNFYVCTCILIDFLQKKIFYSHVTFIMFEKISVCFCLKVCFTTPLLIERLEYISEFKYCIYVYVYIIIPIQCNPIAPILQIQWYFICKPAPYINKKCNLLAPHSTSVYCRSLITLIGKRLMVKQSPSTTQMRDCCAKSRIGYQANFNFFCCSYEKMSSHFIHFFKPWIFVFQLHPKYAKHNLTL